MASFSVISRRAARVHFLTPLGKLDRTTAALLRQEFDAVVRGSAALIVVNLSRLTMLDEAGIELLLEMNTACGGVANRLRVINGARPIARMLERTGAQERLPIMAIRTADPTPI